MPARVFAFEHRGYAFAVPHGRVTRVLAALPEGRDATLLVPANVELGGAGGAGDADATTRKHGDVDVYIELDAGTHSELVLVRAPELADLERPMPLSRVLRSVINLAHIVGWAEIDDHLVWLVDPSRI